MAALIEGRAIKLRPILREDLEQLRKWDEDEEIIHYSGKKFLGESSEDWLRRYLGNTRNRALAIETRDGRFIGDIELEEINWRAGMAELRICIGDKECWDRGFGTDAVVTLLRFAFGTLKLNAIYLRVYSTNLRAIKCYQKCGFSKEGLLKVGRRQPGEGDIVLMTISRERFCRRRFGEMAAAAGSGLVAPG